MKKKKNQKESNKENIVQSTTSYGMKSKEKQNQNEKLKQCNQNPSLKALAQPKAFAFDSRMGTPIRSGNVLKYSKRIIFSRIATEFM